MAAQKNADSDAGSTPCSAATASGAPSVIGQEGELRTLPIQQIQPGKYQPRRHWNDERAGRTGRLDQGAGR